MELWTFQRYQQPRLSVDAIEHEASSRVVSLRSGTQTYRLAFDDPDGAAQIAEDLATLNDSDAPLWAVLRESLPESGWHSLGNFLDSHSLIREARDEAADQLAMQATRSRDCITGTAAAVLERIPPERRMAVAARAASVREGLCAATAIGKFFGAEGDPFDAAAQPNFYLGLLAIEFEYLRRSSPPTLAAADSLLRRIAGESGDQTELKTSGTLPDASGLYDERDLAAHLWLIGHCLASSVSEDAARFKTPRIPTLSLSSGLEFMRQTEILTRATLAGWSPNSYVTAIKALTDPGSPLVAGPFIEQYHVTRRFVEIIAPLLSKRLSGPIRRMMFRYYGEEVGHEALESTTCEALGVSECALGQALPLPLHFAFVDALTLLAELDPITSFAAIMVIEGVFGEPPKMSLRLASVGRANAAFRDVSGEHDELNETLNHNSISRDVFEQISALSAARQRLAVGRILFLLELNHRAWHGIAGFYGPQKSLSLQGPFGRPLAPQG